MTATPPPAGARPILHLSTARTWRGGEQQALWLAEGLARRGRPGLVVAPPGSPFAERAAAAGVPVTGVSACCELDPVAIVRIARAARRAGAVAIHAHDGHAVTLAALAGRLAGIRRLCTRRVDFPLRGRWKYAAMDRVICISEAIRRVCLAGGLAEAKLRVVRSGIDLGRFDTPPSSARLEALREEIVGPWRRKEKPLLLLNVASLTDHKGQKYLLEAMSRVLMKVPQAVLAIAGEGELEAELRQQAGQLALEESVRFLGFRTDVPELLHAADLFVMSSHLEGLCTSAMDAMAAGLAVVVTDAGGLPELVEPGKTGLVAPARDSEALAAALVDLLSDRKRREHFARAGRARARAEFGAEAMVEGTRRVLEELVGC